MRAPSTRCEAGYDGPLYAEIGPRTFPVLVRTGSRLSQIRFRSGDARINDAELRDLQRRMRLVSTPDPDIAGGVALVGRPQRLRPGSRQ